MSRFLGDWRIITGRTWMRLRREAVLAPLPPYVDYWKERQGSLRGIPCTFAETDDWQTYLLKLPAGAVFIEAEDYTVIHWEGIRLEIQTG